MDITGLPGSKRPYLLPADHGERTLVASQLITRIARSADTGGLFEAQVFSGGKGTCLPAHRHDEAHEALLVLDGQVDLLLGSRRFQLTPGDYACIPPGTVHAHRMMSHHTRLLSWTVGADVGAALAALGRPYPGMVHPPVRETTIGAEFLARASSGGDIVFEDVSWPDAISGASTTVPEGVEPYVIEAGTGEVRIAGSTIFSFLTRQRNTNGRFIAVLTEGPVRQRVALHYHEKHTENFFCLAGRMTMWADGAQVDLTPGDFVHVPAHTIHSYQQDAPYTKFFGLLTPGLFEAFFDTFSEPYEDFIFPLEPRPFRYDKIVAGLDHLDVKQVESFLKPHK